MSETNKQILVIEDDLMMQQIVVKKIKSAGFDVLIAKDGKEGLKIWEEKEPDLVLLDLMLPELNGFEVLEKIRKNDTQKISETPVIILSNLWTNKDILRAQNLHIDGYLVKAYFTTDDILKEVEKVIDNRKNRGS